MESSHQNSISLENQGIRLGFVVFAIVICLIPWVFGGAYPPTTTIALALATLAATIFLLMPKLNCHSGLGIAAQIVAFATVGYGFIQIWLPTWLSPDTLAGLSFEGTVYPAESRLRLAELILGVIVFLISAQLFRTSKTWGWLYGLVAANGALLAFFGIVQQLSWNKKIYWLFERVDGGVPFGPYVNRNNAAGYLLICFAASTWFISRRIARTYDRTDHNSWNRKPGIMGSVSRTLTNAWIGFGQLETRQLFQFAGMLLIVCGICFSLSRGSMVALAVSVVVAWVLFFRFNKGSLALLGLLIVSGGGMAVWLGQLETVSNRIETLADLPEAAPARVNHWVEVIPYVQDHWVFGSGLGTYRFVYPEYISSTFESWFYHAENQYIETIAEVGIPGLLSLLVLICLMFYCCYRLLSEENPDTRAIGIVGLVALSGQLVAGAFDFGLYQPANSILMAVIMGSVVGRLSWAQRIARPDNETAPVKWIGSLATRLTLLAGCLAAGWASYEYSSVDASDLAAMKMGRFDHEGTEAELDFCESLLSYAERIRPESDDIYYQQARLSILRYRLAASKLLLEESLAAINGTNGIPTGVSGEGEEGKQENAQPPSPAETVPEALREILPDTLEKVWPLTTVAALNRTAWIAKRREPDIYQQIISGPIVTAHLSDAFRLFKKAESIFSLTPQAQYQLAELSVVIENPPQQSERLKKTLERWPTHPQTMFNAGLLHHHAGETDKTIALWHECMNRTRKFDQPILDYARHELSMKDFFEGVLPQQPEYLFKLAEKYFRNPEDKLVRERLLVHTRRVLSNDDKISDSVRSYLQGEIESAFGQFELAELHFINALKLSPDNVQWRIEFIKVLQQLKKFDEAAKQIQICSLRRDRKYQKAIQRLTVKNNRERNKELLSPTRLHGR